MKRTRTIAVVVALGVALTAGATAWNATSVQEAAPLRPEVPSRVPVTLLEAHPFTLLEPATHWMRAEQPTYTEGWLVVLETSRDVLLPRQTYENVLYVGSETVERINTGAQSGVLVGVVPGSVDLTQAPIFFGEPELPENVTAQEAQRQLQIAFGEGVRAADASAIATAQREAVVLPDAFELQHYASYLIEQYAPDEVDLISGLRVPRLR
jgi:hypothetical protein